MEVILRLLWGDASLLKMGTTVSCTNIVVSSYRQQSVFNNYSKVLFCFLYCK